MSDYNAPLTDMKFALRELADLEAVAQLPGYEDCDSLADPILEQAAKFASEVLAPLNVIGDRCGVQLTDGVVKTAPGWIGAYKQFVEAGWNSLTGAPEFGGQGQPRLVSTLVEEMWDSANVSFALCPLLTHGAIAAIELRGSTALKQMSLPKMVSGEWTGTMNLTEPQAGSDLSAIRTRAELQPDGTYRIFGQKVFITYGDHDMTDNVIHLVLARAIDAPQGVKGISLFVVPKYLIQADGTRGARNDVHCISLEHKLGIHASPTAVMAYGDHGGAAGYLVGTENHGLETMFIMMNAARFAVGLQGIGLSERSYQRALQYAKGRAQGVELGVQKAGRVAIIRHADVRRMLMLMKSQTEAMRALACVVGAASDVAQRHSDPNVRREQQSFVDLMIPVVKGWSTETAIDIASLGIQIHGGLGFIEGTGAAQYWRDARITTIYEGTTGIQANDLVGRKIARDSGRAVRLLIAVMREVEVQLSSHSDAELVAIRRSYAAGLSSLESAVDYLITNYATHGQQASVGAVPFLQLLGVVTGGWQMARAALIAKRRLAEQAADAAFCRAKIITAQFYADHVLSRSQGLAYSVIHGAESALMIPDDQL